MIPIIMSALASIVSQLQLYFLHLLFTIMPTAVGFTSFSSMIWSAICNIIPWAKVNSICHMLIFIHVAYKIFALCPNPFTINGQLYMSYAYFH